jgi:hypothetical protein
MFHHLPPSDTRTQEERIRDSKHQSLQTDLSTKVFSSNWDDYIDKNPISVNNIIVNNLYYLRRPNENDGGIVKITLTTDGRLKLNLVSGNLLLRRNPYIFNPNEERLYELIRNRDIMDGGKPKRKRKTKKGKTKKGKTKKGKSKKTKTKKTK